jgi:glycerol-3-phosphate dehydrogenase
VRVFLHKYAAACVIAAGLAEFDVLGAQVTAHAELTCFILTSIADKICIFYELN